MKVLFLTHNKFIEERLISFFKGIIDLDFSGKAPDQLHEYIENSNITISFGYRFIIPPTLIDEFDTKLINLHISLLPWNKGSDPNFWSFMLNTPKGVSLHFIDNGLDTGNIILQEELFFDEDKETFQSTYTALINQGVELIQRLINDKDNLMKSAKPQPSELGSLHKRSEIQRFLNHYNIDSEFWNQNIKEFKNMYKFPYE